ncbi:MAG: CopG family transcriptional regulator [Solirubrobacteraceae bacterium]
MAKVMISIPDEELARIDGEAARRGTSRSALLRDAALRELEQRDPAGIRRAFEHTRRRLADVKGSEMEAVLAAEKGERDEHDRRRGGLA